MARSVLQGLGVKIFRKDQMFEVNKLFIMWLFALVLQVRNRHVGLCENNTLQLANQSMRSIGYKHKPYNNIY